MKTAEGNKLIAEFMGFDWQNYTKWIVDEDKSYSKMYGNKEIEVPVIIEYLEYHSSWDWLMPVVEKIHLMRIVADVIITPGKTKILMQNPVGKEFSSPFKPENSSITECWICVVEFIKWYNQHK